MKILFLHTDFRVYWIPRLQFLGQYLEKHGHHLTVVEIAGKGSPYSFATRNSSNSLIDWHCMYPDAEMNELSVRKIRRDIFHFLDKERPDIVFAGAIAYPSGTNAVAWGWRRHVPIVIFDDARLCDVKRNLVVNFVKKKIYQNVSAMLIPASSHLPDYLQWGFRENDIFYGLNVIDNDYWEKLVGQECRLPIPLPNQYLLGVGRQISMKNWNSVIEAYQKSDIHIPLILVGNGPERKNLEQMIEELPSNKKVILIDFQSSNVLAHLYANADALILSSYGETWGLVINEALACGCPVIVSRTCGCCETLCIDGKTGFQCTPAVPDIVSALNRLNALSTEERNQMKIEIACLIAQWNIDRFADSVLSIAEKYTKSETKKCFDLFSAIFLSLWYGRYRPV